MTTGGRIRKLREEQGLTQQSLAQRAKISLSFLSEIENDKRNPSGRVLLEIATSLGTTMDYLTRGVEPTVERPRGPIVIPPELAEAAERVGLSYRTTARLAEAYRQIVAQRGSETKEPPTPDEWLEFYRATRRFLED